MKDADFIDTVGIKPLATLCKVSQPSVCYWKQAGIPEARRDFLALIFPDLLGTQVQERVQKWKLSQLS